VWWLDIGHMPDAYTAALTPLLRWTGEENRMKKLMGWDKDREITYQLPSWVEET